MFFIKEKVVEDDLMEVYFFFQFIIYILVIGG